MDEVVLRARMYMNRKRLFRGFMFVAIGMIALFGLVLAALVGVALDTTLPSETGLESRIPGADSQDPFALRFWNGPRTGGAPRPDPLHCIHHDGSMKNAPCGIAEARMGRVSKSDSKTTNRTRQV